MLTVLDLFSGIGGFSLGLERTGGFKTVAFCEIDPFCRRVLAKHWPSVPCYDDIRELDGRSVVADVLCGGFPCQDISSAGKRAGIDGARSGLWKEYARLIGEIRPRYVIVENVAALLVRGLGRVLGDLAALGMDAEWHCIPASAVNAPHRRDRIWIVAYRQADAQRPNADSERPHPAPQYDRRAEFRDEQGCDTRPLGGDVADAEHGGREGRHAQGEGPAAALPCGEGRRSRLAGYLALQLAAIERGGAAEDVADADSEHWRLGADEGGARKYDRDQAGVGGWWFSEPAMGELVDGVSGGLVRFAGRVASGVPNRVNKLRALGNAVVPQIPELIGRAILAAEAA